jgi:hypothetical protein
MDDLVEQGYEIKPAERQIALDEATTFSDYERTHAGLDTARTAQDKYNADALAAEGRDVAAESRDIQAESRDIANQNREDTDAREQDRNLLAVRTGVDPDQLPVNDYSLYLEALDSNADEYSQALSKLDEVQPATDTEFNDVMRDLGFKPNENDTHMLLVSLLRLRYGQGVAGRPTE